MSGGSLEYAYIRVRDVAAEIDRRAETALHRAFATHLVKVATALHDLEWVWSSDKADGDEEEAIRAVLSPQDELESAIAQAKKAYAELTIILARFP